MERVIAKPEGRCGAQTWHVRISRLDSRQPPGKQTVRPICARDFGCVRGHGDESAGRVVSAGQRYDHATRGHGAALSGTTIAVRAVPSPSVREMEPERLLQLCGVLLTGRTQARFTAG